MKPEFLLSKISNHNRKETHEPEATFAGRSLTTVSKEAVSQAVGFSFLNMEVSTMAKYRLVVEVEASENLDWSVIDDYVTRQLENQGEIKVLDISSKELQ